FAAIDVPGAISTQALGINDAGLIVGNFSDGTTVHGFLDAAGSFTTIDVPGASSTIANGINDAGQIVGFFVDNSGEHGFVDTGGSWAKWRRGSALPSPRPISPRIINACSRPSRRTPGSTGCRTSCRRSPIRGCPAAARRPRRTGTAPGTSGPKSRAPPQGSSRA